MYYHLQCPEIVKSETKLLLICSQVSLLASKPSFSLWNCLLKLSATTVSWTWPFHRTLYYTKTLPKMLLLNGSEAFPSYFYSSPFYSENGFFCNMEMCPKNVSLEINPQEQFTSHPNENLEYFQYVSEIILMYRRNK